MKIKNFKNISNIFFRFSEIPEISREILLKILRFLFEISTKCLQKLSNVFSGENFSAVDEFVTVLMLLGVQYIRT